MSLAEDNIHMIKEIKKLLPKIGLSKKQQKYLIKILDDIKRIKPESI